MFNVMLGSMNIFVDPPFVFMETISIGMVVFTGIVMHMGIFVGIVMFIIVFMNSGIFMDVFDGIVISLLMLPFSARATPKLIIKNAESITCVNDPFILVSFLIFCTLTSSNLNLLNDKINLFQLASLLKDRTERDRGDRSKRSKPVILKLQRVP